jgi:hypothetical protein
MRLTLVLGLACCAIGLADREAPAEPSAEAAVLTQEIAAKVPSNWQIRVTWRDKQLLAFVILLIRRPSSCGTNPKSSAPQC